MPSYAKHTSAPMTDTGQYSDVTKKQYMSVNRGSARMKNSGVMRPGFAFHHVLTGFLL